MVVRSPQHRFNRRCCVDQPTTTAPTQQPTARALKTPPTLPRPSSAQPNSHATLLRSRPAWAAQPRQHTNQPRAARKCRHTSALIGLACGSAAQAGRKRTTPKWPLGYAEEQRDTNPIGRAVSRPAFVPQCRRPFAPLRRLRPNSPLRGSCIPTHPPYKPTGRQVLPEP